MAPVCKFFYVLKLCLLLCVRLCASQNSTPADMLVLMQLHTQSHPRSHLDSCKAIKMDVKCSHHLLSLLKHSSNGPFYVDYSLNIFFKSKEEQLNQTQMDQ